MTSQYISNILLNDNDVVTKYGNIMSQKSSYKKYPNIYNYINDWWKVYNCESYKETIVRMKYNIIERPICKMCGGHVSFNKQKRVNGTFFPTYCSHSCQMKDPIQQIKHKHTCIEKYGSSNNIKKSFETRQNIYDNPFFNNVEKRNATNIEKYGCVCPLQNDEIKKKTKDTNIKKYGYEYAQSNSDVKKKMSISLKKALSNKTIIEKKETVHKAMMTKANNMTLSSDEIEVLTYLQNKFGKENVVCQYFEYERYPYNCDFYIKTYDMFIELQANHFVHGDHPFNSNDYNDLIRLQELYKAKEDKLKRTGNAKGYDDAIRIWTYDDVIKRKTAIENKLNFHEYWSVKELKDSIDLI
jgi:hypothetical protein